MVPGIVKAQTYQYKKGDIQKIVVKVNNTTSYQQVNTANGNRVLIDGKWRYFKGDTIALYRTPCENLNFQIVVGAAKGAKKGDAACPLIFNYNYKDSTSCVLFLNRSVSLEQ